jgi:RsmE family RNA methyltransferase
VNSIILFDSDRDQSDPNVFHIEDDFRLNHLNNVVKASVGKMLQLTWLDHKRGVGEVVNLNPFSIKWVKDAPSAESGVHLYVGLSRPPTCKKILEHGSTMGVSSFTFFSTDLGEKSYRSSKLWTEELYKELLHLGLSQSRLYYQMPKVEVLDRMPKVSELAGAFYLDPSCERYLNKKDVDGELEPRFLIGPERGWSDQELSTLSSGELHGRLLSPSVLRVEIATFSLLGQLHLLQNQ